MISEVHNVIILCISDDMYIIFARSLAKFTSIAFNSLNEKEKICIESCIFKWFEICVGQVFDIIHVFLTIKQKYDYSPFHRQLFYLYVLLSTPMG